MSRIHSIEVNYILFNYWLNNLIKRKENNDILFLILENKMYRNNNKILELINNLIDNSYEYKIIKITDIKSINEIQMDRNIILLGHLNMSIEKIFNSKYKILISVYKHLTNFHNNYYYYINNYDLISKESINKIIKLEEKHKLNDLEISLQYLEKKNPIETIKSFNYNIIYNHLFYNFYRYWNNFMANIFQIDFLQSKKELYGFIWYIKIKNYDIPLLCEEKKLTSRLGIAIYRACTLNFYDSNTKIGKFYNKEFGLKSETIHIPGTKPFKKLKIYDLNKINNT